MKKPNNIKYVYKIKDFLKNISQLLEAQSSDSFKYYFNTSVDLKI